uniref:Aspartyl protease n=1 Tax=Pithovirus LCPAC304 TaxID=2506594 RepID=A0A481Z795_9VIRU|nr:MAG: aspartyl protease [Pithovirus LCPAC304]
MDFRITTITCKECFKKLEKEKRNQQREARVGTKKCHRCYERKVVGSFETARICKACFWQGKEATEMICEQCGIKKPSSEYYKSGRYHLFQKKCKLCENVRRQSLKCAKYSIQDDYFDVIDHPNKAYFLGFLYADGYNSQKTGKVKVHLSSKDADLLYKFQKALGMNNPLYDINKTRGEKHFTYKCLMICNLRISDSLAKWGCFQNKTYTLTFPKWLEENHIPHFIRGYFDGDGCLTGSMDKKWGKFKWCMSITGNREFIYALKRVTNKYIKINGSFNVRHPESPTVGVSWVFKGRNQIQRFLDWIYQDSDLYLDRKYQYYQRFLQKLPKYPI